MSNYKKILEKRNKEEEAAAHAFQEFIDTFQNSNPTSKTFVKSGVYNPGSSQHTDEDKGTLYNPMPIHKSSQSSNKKAIECAKLLKDNKFERSKSAKPKSNLELLKEELRLRHMDRNSRPKTKSKDYDSPSETVDVTTNLFLTNLNPKLKEPDLMQIFGVYGALASVKIMWPRVEDRNRSSNIGFVAFMSRKDAETAFTTLGNRDDMRISWGKPIEIPSQPVYVPPELIKMLLPPPQSGLPFNAQPINTNFKFPENEQELNDLLKESIVKVCIPMDKKILILIHRVIEFVIREGPLFEAMLMHREINNPVFYFLFDNKSSLHIYYRWKLYSIMNGDSPNSWSTKPFRMFLNGSIWFPPIIPDYTKGMAEKPKKMFESLSDNQQLRLIQQIKHLDLTKTKISDTMVFCLKHADASKDVVNIICEAFGIPTTKPARKIARLYLVSDILYNTKFKKAPLKGFRDLFEKRLLYIFESLEQTYKTLQGDEKNQFKNRVMKVLRAWEMWRLYSSEYLDKLDAAFLGETDEDSCDEPLDGKLLINRSLNCPTQPEVTLVQAEVKEEHNKENINYENFVQSKWETLDPADIEAQAMSTTKLYEIEMQRIENEKKQVEQTVEYDKLRKIELKVLQFQDDLENGKRRLKKFDSIEEEVDDYRKKCIQKKLYSFEEGCEDFRRKHRRNKK